MSKYTKQWLKLLKAETQNKRKAVAKRTKKLFDSIFEDDKIPKYLNGKATSKNNSSE
jgi:hypothetical protein